MEVFQNHGDAALVASGHGGYGMRLGLGILEACFGFHGPFCELVELRDKLTK